MTPAERVRRLVASGSVAPEEGARLLAAMQDAPPPRSRFAILVDPFERFGGGTAALLGALIGGASVAVSRLGVRFDGLLDLHFNRTMPPTLRVALVDQLAGWLVPAVCFWIYARVASRHVRFIDFLGMAGLARLPILLTGLVLLPIVPAHVTIPPKPSITLLVIAIVSVGCLVANVTLLYKGFKNASGLAGPKLLGAFIGLVLGAEALSKLVIYCFSLIH